MSAHPMLASQKSVHLTTFSGVLATRNSDLSPNKDISHSLLTAVTCHTEPLRTCPCSSSDN